MERHSFQGERQELSRLRVEEDEVADLGKRAGVPSFPMAPVSPPVCTKERRSSRLSELRPVIHYRVLVFEDPCMPKKRFEAIAAQWEVADQVRFLVEHDIVQPVDREIQPNI